MSGTSVYRQNIPIPTAPMYIDGAMTQSWYRFFLSLFERTGGSSGTLLVPGGAVGDVQFNDSGVFGGLTNTQLTARVNVFSSTLKGAAPASGGGTTNFLRADGSWAAVSVSGSAGGDLSGTYPNPTVAKINTVALGSTTATAGNLLIGSGTQWVTQAVSGDAAITSAGVTTVAKVNGVAYPSGPSTGTIPVVTGANTVTYTAATGTGAPVRAGTPTLTGNWQIPGTATNDSAAAGFDGEYISSTVLVGTPVSLTTGTAADVTSISLTAGDWDVYGAVYFNGPGATTVTLVQATVGTVTGTLATAPGQFSNQYLAGATMTTLGADPSLPGMMVRASLSGTTSYFLVAKAAFGASTFNAYGIIFARRVR